MGVARQIHAVALAALALGAAAAPAHALTVGKYGHRIETRDTRGEDNRLRVRIEDRHVVVHEDGPAPLKAGRRCTSPKPQTVICGHPDIQRIIGGPGDDVIEVYAPVLYGRGDDVSIFGGGSGDDYVKVEAAIDYYEIRGGAGDDVLVGGRNRDWMVGGAGNDRLFGKRGSDTLIGDGRFEPTRTYGVPSEHRDTGPVGDDFLDGGQGEDMARWSERSKPVTVDLAKHRAGVRGEHDRVRAVEDVQGGNGPDVLRGNEHRNKLYGGWGADVLVGRKGDDLLGAGVNDQVSERYGTDRARDVLRCGDGRDTVGDPGMSPMRASCELAFDSWSFEPPTPVQPRLDLSGERLILRVVCAGGDPYCRRQVTVRSHGTVIGRSRVREFGGRSPDIQRTMPIKLVRPLPKHGVLTIELTGEDDNDGYPPFPYERTWRVER